MRNKVFYYENMLLVIIRNGNKDKIHMQNDPSFVKKYEFRKIIGILL